MTTTVPNEDRVYEHFIEPKTAGLGNLGTLGMFIMFGGLIVDVIIIFFVGVVTGLVFLLVGGLTFLLVCVPDIEHQSRLQKLSRRIAWKSNTGKGYVSGPLSRIGTYLLPGILAQSKSSEWLDDSGKPFVLVHMPSVNHYAVTWEVHPDGASMSDPADLAANVDRWGNYLKFLCIERSAIQAMVTIVTDQDHRKTLQTTVHGRAATGAPAVAVEAARQIVDRYQKDVPSMRSFVTITFKGTNGTGKRKAAEMAHDLAARLPKLTAKLSATGAGPSKLLTQQRLTEEIRMAIDPGCAPAVAEAQASGNPIMMPWDSLGPPAADNQWTYYRHSSGISVTWSMAAIRGAVTETSSIDLLRPNAGVSIKRVSLIFELHDPGVAPDLTQSDVKSADFSINTSRTTTVKHTKQQTAALVNANDEIRGHGMVNVTAMVTATVRDLKQLPEAESTVDSLGPSARLLLRRNDGTQAASFAQNLPGIGLILKSYSLVPTFMRDSL